MRQRGGRAVWTGVVLLAVGCSGAPEDASPAIGEDDVAPPIVAGEASGLDTVPKALPVPGEGRAEVVEGVLNLEGSREPMTYRLFRSPEGFPLPFSTYVPADMRAEATDPDEGDAVRFVAAFGGVRNQAMYLSARVLPEGLATAQARARARETAEGMGRARPGKGGSFPWALDWYRVEGAGSRVGAVALGRHRGRWFLVVTQHPAEAADGFVPRAARLLDGWRWAEGGGLGT